MAVLVLMLYVMGTSVMSTDVPRTHGKVTSFVPAAANTVSPTIIEIDIDAASGVNNASTTVGSVDAVSKSSNAPMSVKCNTRKSNEQYHVKETNIPDSGKGSLNISSIEELCKAFHFPAENCSCKMLPDVQELLPELCIDEKVDCEFSSTKEMSLALGVVTTVSMVTGVSGNSMVLAVFYRKRKGLPHSKMLIAQLALLDTLFSLMNFLTQVHVLWSDTWQFGRVACKLLISTYTLSSLLSIGYILIIATERYFGILYPFRRNLSSKKMVHSCVALNFLAALAAVTPLIVTTSLGECGICQEWAAERKTAATETAVAYYWFLIIVYLVSPVCVISIFYIAIIRHLSKQAKSSTVINREDIRRKRIKSNHRAMKILLSIMVAFVVCVFPYRVCELYLEYVRANMSTDSVMPVLTFVLNLTYPLHVCVNPVIYTAIDREWRRDVLKMLNLRHDRVNDAKVIAFVNPAFSSKEVVDTVA